MTDCSHRALKGGHGVNDASQVREWGCALTRDHDEPCDYSIPLGMPSTTSASAQAGVGRPAAVLDALRRLDEATPVHILQSLPLDVIHSVQDKARAVRIALEAFGPRREFVPLIEDTITEVERWSGP